MSQVDLFPMSVDRWTPVAAERVNYRVPDRGVSVMFGSLVGRACDGVLEVGVAE